MRIVHVAIRFPPAEGGGEQHVYNLAKQQVKMGHDVHVITTDLMREVPREVDISLPKRETMDGISVIRMSTYPTFLPVWGYGSVYFGLEKVLDEVKPDIVHAHGYGCFYADILARVKRNVAWKLILTAHGFAEGRGVFKYLKMPYDRFIGQKTVCLLDGAISLSKHDKGIFDDFGVDSNKVYVIPNGFDESRYQTLPDPIAFKKRYNISGRIILNISRLAPSKGQKYLIEAFSKIIPDFPDTHLVIIGEDWGEMKRLQALEKELKVGNILIPGLVSGEVVLEAFSAAECFVLPSVAEGLPTVVLEAMACGLPVIATDVGGVAEAVDRAGLVVESKNVDHLVEGIRKFLEDSDLRMSFSRMGRERVKRYEWPVVAKRVVKVYEKLL